MRQDKAGDVLVVLHDGVKRVEGYDEVVRKVQYSCSGWKRREGGQSL